MDYDTPKTSYKEMTLGELMELIPFDGEEDDELIDAALAAKLKELATRK